MTFFSNDGYCATCDRATRFTSENSWLRDFYLCEHCGSLPRERALMMCLEKSYPDFADLDIHECSPGDRGASAKIKRLCKRYVPSHYFADVPGGEMHNGYRCEDLEDLTFADESIDLHISQDVMEHILDPGKAFREIARTLRPGGAHVFTVPLVKKAEPSEIRAERDARGEIVHHGEPEYHGNPIDASGSLVTMHWGYDICDFIYRESGLVSRIMEIDDIEHGVRAEYIDVIITTKAIR